MMRLTIVPFAAELEPLLTYLAPVLIQRLQFIEGWIIAVEIPPTDHPVFGWYPGRQLLKLNRTPLREELRGQL